VGHGADCLTDVDSASNLPERHRVDSDVRQQLAPFEARKVTAWRAAAIGERRRRRATRRRWIDRDAFSIIAPPNFGSGIGKWQAPAGGGARTIGALVTRGVIESIAHGSRCGGEHGTVVAPGARSIERRFVTALPLAPSRGREDRTRSIRSSVPVGENACQRIGSVCPLG
jgi:hypothetical protein